MISTPRFVKTHCAILTVQSGSENTSHEILQSNEQPISLLCRPDETHKGRKFS